eukprot:scaffold321929_cov44-Tisochrysis_lutea.AAC.2
MSRAGDLGPKTLDMRRVLRARLTQTGTSTRMFTAREMASMITPPSMIRDAVEAVGQLAGERAPTSARPTGRAAVNEINRSQEERGDSFNASLWGLPGGVWGPKGIEYVLLHR